MAAVSISDTPDGRRVLALSGRLDSATLAEVWNQARRAAAEAPTRPFVVDAAGVDYCDGAGAALFVELLRQPREAKVEVANLKPAFAALLSQFHPEVLLHDLDPEPPRRPAIEEVGFAVTVVWRDIRAQIEFIGELTSALWFALRASRDSCDGRTSGASASGSAPTRCRSSR